MPGLVLVAWPPPREPGRGWRSPEEPGGAAPAQLPLAGSQGPSTAQPGEPQGRRENSALLAFLCAPGTRTAEPWAQERSDPAAPSQTPLPSTALPPVSAQPGCLAQRLVVTPQPPPAPRFARTGCSTAKAAPSPLPWRKCRGGGRGRGAASPAGASWCSLSPVPLQHITPQAVWRQRRVRRF